MSVIHTFDWIANCYWYFLDVKDIHARSTEAVYVKLRDPKVAYMVETLNEPSTEDPQPIILHGADLYLNAELSNGAFSDVTAQEANQKPLLCSYFCLRSKNMTTFTSMEEVNFIKIKHVHSGCNAIIMLNLAIYSKFCSTFKSTLSVLLL